MPECSVGRRAAGLVLALLVGCRSAPPPPPAGDSAAAPAPADTISRAHDSGGVTDNPPPATDTGRRRATLADLRADIMRMIADAGAPDAGMCRTVAFGAKPCGGPREYLVYSAGTTDSSALAQAIARYNALDAETNQREGRVSDCMLVAPPAVALVNGRCTSAPAPVGPGGK